MHQPIANDMQADHQYWLLEIARWQNYLGTWLQEKDEFVAEAKRFLERIEQYCADLKWYGETLEAHRREIANAGRTLVDTALDGDSITRESHCRRKRQHEALNRLHESLQNQSHAMRELIAVLRPQ